MTLDELRASEKPYVVPSEIAPILGCSAQYLRETAHQRPDALGFPVCVIRTRVRIPRVPFLQFLEGRAV